MRNVTKIYQLNICYTRYGTVGSVSWTSYNFLKKENAEKHVNNLKVSDSCKVTTEINEIAVIFDDQTKEISFLNEDLGKFIRLEDEELQERYCKNEIKNLCKRKYAHEDEIIDEMFDKLEPKKKKKLIESVLDKNLK
jgi:hypothetical protein